MGRVLDYSAGKISGEAIRTANCDGSVRYAGTPGRTKNITKAEFDSHRAAGRGVALIYENTTGDALKGYAAGQAAARAIAADADAIGFPRSTRPLYFACDTDVVTEAQFAAVMSYLDGAASVLGGAARVGVYGEYEVVRRALEGGHARYAWQTAAWSGGWHYGAHLYQHVGTVYVGGIACDYNDVLQADWGQHNFVEEDMPDPNVQAFVDGWLAQYEYSRGPLGSERNATTAGAKSAAAVVLVEDFMQGVVDAVGTDKNVREWAPMMVRRLAAIQPGTPITDQQVADLAATLGQHLGDEVAEALGRKLIAN